MSHLTTTKPFFRVVGVANEWGFIYSASPIGTELHTADGATLVEYDTEQELADWMDNFVGQPGWYWECENRIPYPPNPNEWSYTDCLQAREE